MVTSSSMDTKLRMCSDPMWQIYRVARKYSDTKISIWNIFSLGDIGDFWLWISFSTTLPLSSKCANIQIGPLIRKLSPPANQTHLWVSLWEINPVLLWRACAIAKCVTTYGPPCTLYIAKYLKTMAYLKCTRSHKQTTKCDNHYWWLNNARCSTSRR